MAVRDVAVHFVGGDLVIAFEAELAGGFEQHVRAVDIGLDEGVRVHDRAIHVGLGREIDDGVDVVVLDHPLDGCARRRCRHG